MRAAAFAEHDVFRHAQARHQHEMLVDHADAVRDRIRAGREADLGAVDQDLPAVGGDQPDEHVHQRRFTGAVFAEEPQHLALGQRQVHPVVGGKAGIALG